MLRCPNHMGVGVAGRSEKAVGGSGEDVMPQFGEALSAKAPPSGRIGEAAPPKTEG
jgi:hypothetical protein